MQSLARGRCWVKADSSQADVALRSCQIGAIVESANAHGIDRKRS